MRERERGRDETGCSVVRGYGGSLDIAFIVSSHEDVAKRQYCIREGEDSGSAVGFTLTEPEMVAPIRPLSSPPEPQTAKVPSVLLEADFLGNWGRKD